MPPDKYGSIQRCLRPNRRIKAGQETGFAGEDARSTRLRIGVGLQHNPT
jgi:hypothetical protein